MSLVDLKLEILIRGLQEEVETYEYPNPPNLIEAEKSIYEYVDRVILLKASRRVGMWSSHI